MITTNNILDVKYHKFLYFLTDEVKTRKVDINKEWERQKPMLFPLNSVTVKHWLMWLKYKNFSNVNITINQLQSAVKLNNSGTSFLYFIWNIINPYYHY